VATADGREHVAWSCSGCHARPDANGRLIAGAPAVTLDRGAMSPPMPDGSTPKAWSWGPGRLDVTADGVQNPTAIPDLRATSHQSHLHWEATLVSGLAALAMRVETLIIENAHQQLRPPREVAVALALYIESLGEVGQPGDPSAEPVGAALFEQHCAQCHHADGGSAAPVDVEVVGTDRRAADSSERGTGHYRIPSLWGIADRGPLLHDGSVGDLSALLDPDRLTTTKGHAFGLDLTPSQRTALIAFVSTIGE
jgi:cytochrome c553